jgi:hypothetical protein
MLRSIARRLAFTTLAAQLAAGAAAAADPPPAGGDPTPAQRQQMAALHRKMADCLASERPVSECRSEMHSGCVAALGPQGCPRMGGMGMTGRGAMRGRGIMGDPTPPAPAQP